MRVLLVCNAAMSTGIMMAKMEEEAEKQALDLDIEAVPLSEIEEYLEHADAILLGPQIRFATKDVMKMVGGRIPVLAMDLQDFGLMRADKVIKQLLEAIS